MTTPSYTPSSASTGDVRTLVALVAEIERSQQQQDVDGFLALFAPAAVWVNGAGRRLIGLEEISEFTRGVLPGAMTDGSVTYEVEHIAFVTADIALTGVRQQYLDGDGKPLTEDGAGSPTYLWHRTAGEWKIVAGQNTAVIT
jgi:uncharacterized protein (TIGR02246 family)